MHDAQEDRRCQEVEEDCSHGGSAFRLRLQGKYGAIEPA
jgi:hypothetical protein